MSSFASRRRLAWLGTLLLVMLLVPRGCRGIYASLFLNLVAARATEGAGEQEGKAMKLLDFVHRQLRMVREPVLDDGALPPLLRGYGQCDHAVLAFLYLAAEEGMAGRMLHLRRADGVSPHAVAELRIGDGWAIFDPARGRTYRLGTGRLAGRDDLLAHAALLKDSNTPAEWYRHARVFLEVQSSVHESSLRTALKRMLKTLARLSPRRQWNFRPKGTTAGAIHWRPTAQRS